MKKLIALLVLFVLLMTATLQAQTYAIGHVQVTYTDPARAGRSIQTEIYYPATTAGTGVPVSSGTFPVIVFGHGFVMAWDAYQNFWEDLVPQGYIVAFPRTEGSFSPVHAEFGKDLTFLVSKLQNESAVNSSSPFYNHINSKSALMGHSMGGGSAFLAAEYNTAITTLVTFAAATTSPSSITAAQHISIPTMVFAGENDCVAPPVSNQLPMYDSLSSICKTYVRIKGAAHCEFANNNFNCAFGESTCSPSPTITRAQQQDATSDFLKLWLDYYLKDNCSAWTTFNDSLSASPRIIYAQACSVNSPLITLSGGVLTSTPASSYQWYWNGSLIPGAVAQNYTPTAPGNYYVSTTYVTTCAFISNTINITTTSIENNNSPLFFYVYPDPATEVLNIDLSYGKETEADIVVMNIVGQKITTKNSVRISNDRHAEKIDLSALSKGVYFIEVTLEGSRYVKRVIKD